jgi:hypothetical protein
MVVHERAASTPFSEVARDETSDSSAPISAQLNDDEYALLERYLARRETLERDRLASFDEQIARRMGNRLPQGTLVGPRLQRLYMQEKELRARGVASPSDTGAAREQHAIVAAGAQRWKRFAAFVAAARKRGLQKLSEDEVQEFVAQYREVSTDLARLRTASRGRDNDSAFYLSRLIAAGHNLLYKQRQLIPLIAWNFLFVTVPREVRRSAPVILLAALFLFGPAAVAHFAIARNPVAAEGILPPGMIDRNRYQPRAARRGLPARSDRAGARCRVVQLSGDEQRARGL